MSEEEALRKLKESKKQKDKAYTKIKGMIEGIRLGKLEPMEKSVLSVIEAMYDGFKSVWEDIYSSFELQLQTISRVSNLETRVSELETNILQLRQTLDKMVQDR